MLKKLVDKRNLIIIILSAILFASWVLYFAFGVDADKILFLVLTPVLPALVYFFVRFIMFKLVRIKAPIKIINFGVWFFLIMGSIGTVVCLIEFIIGFPNGLSPTLGACMGLIVAALDEAKKNFASNEQKQV